MSTRPDSRQIRQRDALTKIGVAAADSQAVVNDQLNQHADQPLRLSQSYPADARLNFSDSLVLDADGAYKVAPAVQGVVFDSLSGLFINFQTQAVSSAPDFEIVWPASTVGRFRRCAFVLNADGKIEAVFSAEALTQGALANAGDLLPQGVQPLGYADLECTNVLGYFKTAGSATNVIENQGLYRFAQGGGGGSEAYVESAVANNQASPADVDEFFVDPADNQVFTAEIGIERVYEGSPDGTEDLGFYSGLTAAGNNAGFGNDVIVIEVQPDGKALVGGAFVSLNGITRHRLVRIDSTGAVDTAFQTNIGSGFASNVLSIALQSDGKILVGGAFGTFNGNTRNSLVRLNSDGTEDAAFYANLYAGGGIVSNVYSIVVQPDGKIVLGLRNATTRVIRLNSDGTEDTAFQTNLGTLFAGPGQPITYVALQSDGKILVGGSFTTFNSNTRNRLVRLNSDGTEDTAFYTNLGTGFNNALFSLFLDADGKILVGGNFTDLNGNTRNRLVRLNSDGTEDTAFYTSLGTGFAGNVVATRVQLDGKIIIGGAFTSFNGNTRNYLVRVNSDGTEDTAFYTNLGTGFNSQVQTITFDSLYELYVGGTFTALNGSTRGHMVRLDSIGTELLEYIKLNGIFTPSAATWDVSAGPGFGSDAGVDFSMTPAGQLQYVSDDQPGTPVVSRLRYVLRRL